MMTNPLGETLRRLRTEKGLSQQQLAERLHVVRASVTNWEIGRRMPTVATVIQIAQVLGVDPAVLLEESEEQEQIPHVLLLDDEAIIVEGCIPVIQKALPYAKVEGFSQISPAMDYLRENPVAIVFLDIELGRHSGLTLCQEILAIRPRTNVIFLTAYMEYSLDAWSTGASGFLLKPLAEEDVREELTRLRYPIKGGCHGNDLL